MKDQSFTVFKIKKMKRQNDKISITAGDEMKKVFKNIFTTENIFRIFSNRILKIGTLEYDKNCGLKRYFKNIIIRIKEYAFNELITYEGTTTWLDLLPPPLSRYSQHFF